MQAIVYEQYGPPELLQLKEVAKPVPGEHQVLVKVHAASLNALDWRRFAMPSVVARLMSGGLRQPKTQSMGADLSGRVEAVGPLVTEFRPGDAVFGVAQGTFAEYVCANEKKLAPKPEPVSFEAAAAAPVAALTALQGLRDKGQIQAGHKVLIDGASGGVGTFAVQIAKSFGAEVTAVCSARNLDMARSIGADHVMDYTREDFTRHKSRYDLILAVNGHHPLRHYRRALAPQGRCVVAGGPVSQVLQSMLLGPLLSRGDGRQVAFMGIATTPKADLLAIQALLESGQIVPVIDGYYPLSGVPKAIRYLLDEHAQGKVVIRLESGGAA